MAAAFEYTQHFSSSPMETFSMLMDSSYINAKCAATGSQHTTAQVDGDITGPVVIRSVRVLPAEVPAVAKSFVGETIEVTEVQEWSAPASDGSRTGTVDVTFSGPLAFRGTIELFATNDGCAIRTVGKMKATVPFVGGQIEEVAVKQTERYLRAEEAIAADWLSR
jgi:hypothetical protein